MLYLSRKEDEAAMNDRTHLSIRMNTELHDKFQYVATYEGRSMSGQILYLMLTAVRQFEKEHGPIVLEKPE